MPTQRRPIGVALPADSVTSPQPRPSERDLSPGKLMALGVIAPLFAGWCYIALPPGLLPPVVVHVLQLLVLVAALVGLVAFVLGLVTWGRRLWIRLSCKKT